MNLRPFEPSALQETSQLSEQLAFQIRDALQTLQILREKCNISGMEQTDTGSHVLGYLLRIEEALRIINNQADDINHIFRMLYDQIQELQQVYGPPPFNNFDKR